MKWIGQQVYDFISRFRNEVYLEDVSSGTIASGGHLGLDSNNKIVKATVSSGSGDIEGVTAGTGLSGGGTTGTVTLNVEAAQPGITSLGTLTGLTIDGNKNVTPGDGAMLHIDASTITDNNTSASGTAAEYNHVHIEASTLAATNASVTTTNAAVLKVGRMYAGTNQTITNPYSILTGGAIGCTGLITSDYEQNAGDMTLYDATNDGNPTFSIGSSATERLEIKAEYESGAQGLDVVKFITHTAGSSSDDARYSFQVDESFIFKIKDNGVQLKASGHIEIGDGNTILSDSSGTTTLNNIDALDATTESTIETAIDTLSNLTTVGTIGTGVWEGTAVATDYTKHLQHFDFQGYGTGDGTNFEISKQVSVNTAPFNHDTSIGSDGLTAQTVQTWMRAGGKVMPKACTLKRITGWSTCAGSATANIGLFKVTPTRDDNSDVSAVELADISYTAMGNAKMEDHDVTSFTATAIAAGDILFTAIKSESGAIQYFSLTIEVEF